VATSNWLGLVGVALSSAFLLGSNLFDVGSLLGAMPGVGLVGVALLTACMTVSF